MAYDVNALAGKLHRSAYTPLTEDEILEAARRQAQWEAQGQTLAAKQAHEITDAALARQASSLGAGYARQMEAAGAAAAKALSEADRHALSRGMQRSSYAGQTRANLRAAGNRTLADIDAAHTNQAQDIEAQRATAARHLAETLAQAKQSADARAITLADALRAREYERGVDALRYENELTMALYEYANREAQQALAQQQWLMEWNRAQAKAGSSSSRSTAKNATPTAQKTGKTIKSVTKTTQPAYSGLWGAGISSR